MSTSAITRTEAVDGWVLSFASCEADGEPLFRDLDIAERAGLADPIDIRRTIERAIKDGEITIPVAARNGELSCFGMVVPETIKTGVAPRQVNAYYLDEEATLEILMRLRTPAARALRKDVRRVYLAWRRGHLVAAPLALDTATVSSARIRDNPAAMATLRRAIKRIVLATGCTTQRVYGLIRKTEKPSSAFDLSVLRLEPLVRWLEQIESGAVALLSKREVKAIAAGKKAAAEQMNLRFNDGETH